MIEKYQRRLFEQQTPYLQWLKSQEENNRFLTCDCIEGKHVSMLPFFECDEQLRECVQRAGYQSIKELQNSDIVIFYGENGYLEKNAVAFFCDYFEKHPEQVIVYADEDALGTLQEFYGECVEENAIAKEYRYKDTSYYRGNPWFKPEFSPDTLEHFFYFGKIFAIRGNALKIEHENNDTIYDMVLDIVSVNAPAGHISEVLYTNQSVKEQERVLGVKRPDHTCSVNVGQDVVSVVIPSKDNSEMLARCMETLVQITEYPYYELILVDNGSTEDEKARINDVMEQIKQIYTDKWQKELGITYLYQKEEFNFSRMCNRGAKCAQGNYLLFLNDDIEIIESDWLKKMILYAQKEHVGAVGVKLYYPKQSPDEEYRIQHVGITNMGIGPAHKLAGCMDCGDIYFGHNNRIYNMLAVTGACLMIRRQLFEQEQGFDELFAVAYNDVELCFRLYRKGYYNVARNDVCLIHHESVSRGQDTSPKKMQRLKKEKQRLDEKHPQLKGKDPFYHKNLVQWKKDVAYHCNVSFLYDESVDVHCMSMREKKKLPKEHHNKWIRKITGENRVMLQIDRVESDTQEVVIEGWAALHKRDNAYIELQLLLKQEDGDNMYVLPVYKQLRYDVEMLFDKQDTPHAALNGIHVIVKKEMLNRGVYQIGIKMIDKKSGGSYVCFSTEKLYIES